MSLNSKAVTVMSDNSKCNMGNYERCQEQFRIEEPEYFNFSIDIIDRRASESPDAPAMLWVNQQDHEQRFTFRDLSILSQRAANVLAGFGIEPGDRVLLLLPRLPEWWFCAMGLIRLGAVHCPAPVLLTPRDLEHRLQAGKFKMVITNHENAGKIEEIRRHCPNLHYPVIVDGPRVDWLDFAEAMNRAADTFIPAVKTRSSDPMVIYFTSGTSKEPKMVQHGFSYPLGHEITARFWHDLRPGDLHFTVSDTGWAKSSWGSFYGQWLVGACVFVYDIRSKFHAAEFLEILEKYQVTVFCAPPTLYRMLVLQDLRKYDLSHLRHCCTAGEPINKETMKIWEEGTGLKLHEGYGQTETVCMIAMFPCVEQRPGAMGKASPGWQLELHDDEGNPVPDGTAGRLAVNLTRRPVGLFQGYLDSPESNAESFKNGYYYTGDRTIRDTDGYFWFIGRTDDVIKSSGYRIGPLEVENAIMEHPAVRETAVIGIPDELRGEVVKAYIILKDGYQPTEALAHEIQQMVKNNTAPYKYPRQIEFAETLPKTYSGKIQRKLLRTHALEQLAREETSAAN